MDTLDTVGHRWLQTSLRRVFCSGSRAPVGRSQGRRGDCLGDETSGTASPTLQSQTESSETAATRTRRRSNKLHRQTPGGQTSPRQTREEDLLLLPGLSPPPNTPARNHHQDQVVTTVLLPHIHLLQVWRRNYRSNSTNNSCSSGHGWRRASWPRLLAPPPAP